MGEDRGRLSWQTDVRQIPLVESAIDGRIVVRRVLNLVETPGDILAYGR